MEIINLNPTGPHTHIADADTLEFEPWLENRFTSVSNAMAFKEHTHPPHRGPIVRSFPSGLAANTWVQILSQGSLTLRKVWVFKILVECGSQSPYSGAGARLIATTNCHGANTTLTSTPLIMHTGAAINFVTRISGGSQNSPAIEIQLPVALPNASTITAEFLELF